MTMDDKEFRALMDAEARDAEAAAQEPDDGAPLPAHVTVSRPNQSRSKLLDEQAGQPAVPE